MPKRDCVSSREFQSLLHQGISLLLGAFIPHDTTLLAVSIPSSSGHQFTGYYVPTVECKPHRCFNPFFIRASVYCSTGGPRSRAGRRTGFNPFFIRASVYWVDLLILFTEIRWLAVSIPSSSGHQFTGLRPKRLSVVLSAVSIPSSSGHQFTER